MLKECITSGEVTDKVGFENIGQVNKDAVIFILGTPKYSVY